MASAGDHGEHGTFDGMAVEHVLGSLSEDDARLFRAHLLQCQHCRARVGELRTIAHDLAGVERAASREERAGGAGEPVRAPARPERAEEAALPRQRDGWQRKAWLVVALAAVVGVAVALAAWGVGLRGEVRDLERDVRIEERAAQVSALGEAWEVGSAADGVEAAVAEDGEVLVIVADGLPQGADRLRLLDEGGTPTHDLGVAPDEGALVRVVFSVTCDVESLELLAGDTAVLTAARVCEGD